MFCKIVYLHGTLYIEALTTILNYRAEIREIIFGGLIFFHGFFWVLIFVPIPSSMSLEIQRTPMGLTVFLEQWITACCLELELRNNETF